MGILIYTTRSIGIIKCRVLVFHEEDSVFGNGPPSPPQQQQTLHMIDAYAPPPPLPEGLHFFYPVRNQILPSKVFISSKLVRGDYYEEIMDTDIG